MAKKKKELAFSIPYPPSVNSYLARRRGGGVMLTATARNYKSDIKIRLHKVKPPKPTTARLSISLQVYVPDKRKRDIDNILKVLLDALEGVIYQDDSQADELHVVRAGFVKGGRVDVVIKEL